MEKEEQLFRKRVLELAELCFHRDMPSNTDFLNLNEQTIFQSISGTLPPVRYVLAGGFPGSERKVVCFLPSYEEELTDPPFECLRISARNKKFSGELTHRDFLGALMNLGIERAMIGDIVVKDLDGYVMVLKKISRYVLENLDTVGRTAVEAAVWEGAEELLEPEYEEVAGTVSSVRLDAVVALCGRVSRTKAAGLIAGDKVFINGQAVLSPSRQMEPGEILSIRGVGKFLFSRNGGQTKKGRISVTFLKYR